MPEFTDFELQVLKQMEDELPRLNPYPIRFVDRVLYGKQYKKYINLMGVRYFKSKRKISFDIPPLKFEKREWFFSPSSEFLKSISLLDKNLKGRILEAITKICKNPKETHGDTIKPLSGDLKGKWRYRVGEYRLIYQPDDGAHIVFLLAVFPRGEAYGD